MKNKQNKLFKNLIKRSTAVAMTVAFLAMTTIVTYAVISLLLSETQTSNYSKKTIFECDTTDFFTASGEVGPSESVSINPVIKSDATVDMFVFIRVVMPAYGEIGLYTMTANNS